jgi:hypothetical protein
VLKTGRPFPDWAVKEYHQRKLPRRRKYRQT